MVAAADSLLEVRVVRELDSVLLLLSVVEEAAALVVESELVVDDSSVLLLPLALAVEEPEAVLAPDETGREAVPSAPATVKAGAKLKLSELSSSVMRMVYSVPASTASAGMVKEADSAEAGTPAAICQWDVRNAERGCVQAKTMPLPASWSVPEYCSSMVTVPSEGFCQVMVVAEPAVTSREDSPLGMLMAFSWPRTRAA